MKISFNWLNEYIDVGEYSQIELADKLTMAGIEVEDIEEKGANIPETVVVAEILERNTHPDAEKLSVCVVNAGGDNLQVVCGAPNCDAGNKVPLATVGTVFIEDGKKFKIKKSKLRGVPSFGMLCSSKELGLDGSHEGLMELDSNAIVGTPVKKILDSDTIYEVEITPNRPDWLSHWGVARDLTALIKEPSKFPKVKKDLPSSIEKFDNLITIEDSNLCPRYTARVIRGVEVKESPEWLKKHLLNIGLRPINNIVDITNFVLMELGHPLHAFDLNLIEDNKIVVRSAKNNEKIKTLDGNEYELNSSNLLICDSSKPIALAGVMGGEESGVTNSTVDILLESAVFKPSSIRATAKKLKISSDSSFRFERGVDWQMCETASDRAVNLILELAGGTLVTELIEEKTDEPIFPPVVCRFDKIRSLLGVVVSNKEITDIFTGLALKVSDVDDEKCTVTPPSFRLDISREADLAEEVARIHGLDKLPIKTVTAKSGGSITKDAYLPLEEITNDFISLGLNETVNYSLINSDRALLDARFASSDLKTLQNPLSSELASLRPSLFAQILESVERNISRKNIDLSIFETGRVYCANTELFPEERLECVVAITGRKHSERFSDEKSELYDFYDLKGILESWFDLKKLKCEFRKLSDDNKAIGNYKSGVAAEMLLNGKAIATLGEVSPKLTNGMRLNTPLFVAIIQLEKFANIVIPGEKRSKTIETKILFEQLSHFPSTTRDVAFIANSTLEHGAIIDLINKTKVKNLVKVELFDIFEDEKNIGKNKKSMAYSLTFRNSERTLTDKEVNNAHEKLRARLAKELPIELR